MIVNAKASSTFIGREGHDIPTCQVRFDWGGGSQSCGGYDLRHEGHSQFIQSVIDVAGVDSWEALAGQFMRIDQTHIAIARIGHIVEDKWFVPGAGIQKEDGSDV